ncbi:MAG: hypothetical protein AB7F40_03055 [Victivallaceae bacterium]|nr:hypothetical protein [Victivallaceae bacterium]
MGNESEVKSNAASEPAKESKPETAATRPPVPPGIMPAMIRCPVCGEPMAVTAMFCRRCGKVFIINTATVLTGVIVVTSFFLAMIGIVLSMLSFGVALLIKGIAG